MAASTDFNYENLLSLDKAKLFGRKRLNFLGTKELILDYNLQTGGAKEEATEWLEANRLTLTDPKFGFKTYDGTWKCIEIAFNEDKKVIRQRFQIDSALSGNSSLKSAAEDIMRSYYWKIVDPDAYNVPIYTSIPSGAVVPTALTNAIWTDSGTEEDSEAVYYDETLAYALWKDGTDYYVTVLADVGTTPTNYFKSTTGIDKTYTGAGTFSGTFDISLLIDQGEIWKKTVGDNGDGTYDVIISRSTYNQISGIGAVRPSSLSGTNAGSNSVFVSGCSDTDYNGEYTYQGLDGNDLPFWAMASTNKGFFNNTKPAWNNPFTGIDEDKWYFADYPYAGSGDFDIPDFTLKTAYLTSLPIVAYNTVDVEQNMSIEIGRPGIAFTEDSEITINDTEQTFVDDGGSIANPISGELKTISNVPLNNGLFRSTVTTKQSFSQRFPALYGAYYYSSKATVDSNAIIIGKNRSLQEFNEDVRFISEDSNFNAALGKDLYDIGITTSLSVSLNDYGRIDYTILANKK